MDENSLQSLVSVIQGGRSKYIISQSIIPLVLILTISSIVYFVWKMSAINVIPITFVLILTTQFRIRQQWIKLARQADELGITNEIAESVSTGIKDL